MTFRDAGSGRVFGRDWPVARARHEDALPGLGDGTRSARPESPRSLSSWCRHDDGDLWAQEAVKEKREVETDVAELCFCGSISKEGVCEQ